jgi:hypothetical protein
MKQSSNVEILVGVTADDSANPEVYNMPRRLLEWSHLLRDAIDLQNRHSGTDPPKLTLNTVEKNIFQLYVS